MPLMLNFSIIIMLVICILPALWLRVTTETLLNVAFAQQRVDCEYLLNTFIMAKAKFGQR